MSVATKLKRASIRELNNRLRTKYEGGRILISCSIQSYGPDFVRRCLQAVSAFDGFTEDNDPHGEHDCAFLEVEGSRIMFKIDYYDTSLQYASPNPAVEAITCRIITIMLAEEY